MCAQRTNIKVFQGPATELIRAEELSEALGGCPESGSRDPQPSHLLGHPENPPPPSLAPPDAADALCSCTVAPLAGLELVPYSTAVA